MSTPPCQTRPQAAANAPPPEVAAAPTKRCQIIVWLRPCDASAPVADPPPSPVGPAALEPLFLGMDDDTVASSAPGSPLPTRVASGLVEDDYSPTSPPRNLYNMDAGRPPLDLTTPECQAAWEVELARTPTPPPTVDAVLASSWAATPVYQLEVQPLMPPPHWCFNLGVLCFASAFSNPFGECNWIPRACVHCYLAGLGHCEHDIPAHPGMEYLGDSTPSLQPRGSNQAEQAHLTVAGGDCPGLVCSEEQVVDPDMTHGWVTAMRVLWHLCCHQLVSSLLQALQLFVECHNQLYSEHQPHESVTESGGPPDRINTWVEPTVNEQWTRAALAAPVVPSGYVDM
ncbi:hypothetical protein NDA13_000875 [Ustilago tritici]|nr:hypothetical protein NDA13_000875 [Ustilago tritici]